MPIDFSRAPLDPSAEAHRLRNELDACGRIIERIRYLRLLKELSEGANPEINTDKQTLISEMEELGFRRDIVDALQEVERKLTGASTTFDFRGCMDLSRAAFEKIVEEAARRSAPLKSKPLPPAGSGPFAPWKQLLQNCGVVDDKEADLLQKFYGFVSSAGTHDLGSAAQEARLTKNIAIELGLLLVSRVQKLAG
jgi:hypothetical protein